MNKKGFLAIFIVATGIIFLLWTAKGGKERTIKEVKAYDEASIELTKTNMAALQRSIISFTAQEGRTPKSIRELQALYALPSANLDAWGTSIKYERLSAEEFRLISAGKDRAFGTSDDIVLKY